MARKMDNAMTDALFLVGGGLAGAGLALLFAPQSGKKCRRDIARFSRTVGKQSDRVARSISDSMSAFSDRVGGMTSGMWHRR